MSVTIDRSFQGYVGLSTDDKPDDAPPGSHFRETDTGAEYYFDGASWLAAPSVALTAASKKQSSDASAEAQRLQVLILRELRRVVLLLALAQGIPASAFEQVPELDGVAII